MTHERDYNARYTNVINLCINIIFKMYFNALEHEIP